MFSCIREELGLSGPLSHVCGSQFQLWPEESATAMLVHHPSLVHSNSRGNTCSVSVQRRVPADQPARTSLLVDRRYGVSPPVAEFVIERPSLKPAVRTAMMVAVTMSIVALIAALAEKTATVTLLILASAAPPVWDARRGN